MGEWPKAREQYFYLLDSGSQALGQGTKKKEEALKEPRRALALTVCAGLLRAGTASQAEPWLAQLEEIEPKSFRVVTLRAQLLGKQGEVEKAVSLLHAFEQENKKESARVALLLEQLGQAKLAEALFARSDVTALRRQT